ncbi:MAG: LysM domain-containing protein [Defluviitaleaceae bacterium]|nr:LysM domain-containing protein [Defluviitaleaceae bacterium]
MKDFTLPSNIKQIGSIGDGQRIYMEDYVYTFLHQYAESAGFEERLAWLVGRNMMIDGQTFLFVGGAIHGKHVEKYEGHLRFTEKSVDYAEEMLDEHFPGMEVVGWMQSQPSYGTYLNQYYGAYHMRQFRKAHQVLFVMDPLERANAFYMANPTALTPADRLTEVSGYFIYYEKNTNMHEYMLANKAMDYTTKSPTMVEFTPLEYVAEPKDPMEDIRFEDQFEADDQVEGRFAFGTPPREKPAPDPEKVIQRHEAAKNKRKGIVLEQKRATNLLAGLCAVLFVVTFVMGVGLVRNQDRIDRMEGEVRQITTAFRNHMANPIVSDTAQPVFAETAQPPQQATPVQPTPQPVEPVATQPTPTPTPTPEPTPTPTPTPSTIPSADTVLAGGEQAALIPDIPETYTIQLGDSLIAISLYFFGTADRVQDILELNGIQDANMIVEGRTIALPRR